MAWGPRPGSRLGRIVILNGAPRSGKSSIVEAVQARFEGPWINLGVDVQRHATPERYQPGIGLRPGGERPDLEDAVAAMYRALHRSIAAHCRNGLNVASDVGYHDGYSKPLGVLFDAASQLHRLPVLFVGVRCSIDEIVRRRRGDGGPLAGADDHEHRRRAEVWESAVHRPGLYDLEVQTDAMSPAECADAIGLGCDTAPDSSALAQLARPGRTGRDDGSRWRGGR